MPSNNSDMTFDQMLLRFIGREIVDVDVDAENQEVVVFLNDGTAMTVGRSDCDGIYLMHVESPAGGSH